jgi:tRNA pseudouridine38-40 synthase
MAPTFRLTLEYDGAGFQGWQAQPAGQRTVQATLEQALARVTGQRVRVMGSGRTDAGVHAEGQVASVRVESRLPPERLRLALNGVLPADLAVVALEPAPEGFDARRDARSKLYRYALWNGPTRSPLREARTLCLQRPLDVAAMREAAVALVGTHDFRSFQAAGGSVTTSIRTLSSLEIVGEAGGAIDLLFEGSGFLRQMVRNLVGTLIEVGSGQRPAGELPAVLAARDRARAGPTAPARALTLVRVRYEGDSVDRSAG